MTRCRLAPSPTGAQHLGNARTHLIAFWATRKLGGELVFRIDDLDSPRVKAWAFDQAIEDIRWLGIEWDGPVIRQSDHEQYYRRAFESLAEPSRNLAYPCYCSRSDIEEALSAPHESRFRGEQPPYPGTCQDYRPGDSIDQREHCWRLRVRSVVAEFEDLHLGRLRCNPALELGDFPIKTKAGQVSYQLAVVVDDDRQAVDLVVRGNDLVASTFRQLELMSHLGLTPPRYAHVPLVRGRDGKRLAKRHGDTRLSTYRDRGVRPEQIIGWAAHSLGLTDRNEPIAASDVIELFDWTKLPSEDTLIDPETLFTP